MPTQVAHFASVAVVSLHSLANASFALTGSYHGGGGRSAAWVLCVSAAEGGRVFGWGNNEYGQLGVASTEPQVRQAAVDHTPLTLSPLSSGVEPNGGGCLVARWASGCHSSRRDLHCFPDW